jgi:maltokinase
VVARTEHGERYQLLLDRAALEAGSCVDATTVPALALQLLRVAAGRDASSVRPIGVEQSNTSLVYDERIILKVFRRLQGHNPEVEMTVALHGAGFANVIEPLAVWQADGDDAALLQLFLPDSLDGWALALRDGVDGRELGEMTAAMHAACAAAFGAADGDPAAWAVAIRDRVAAVDHPDLDRAAIDQRLSSLVAMDDVGAAIRVHGDYHLGNLLRAGRSWYVVDFEGEPTRPVAERRRPSSPLRDVAAMLRSFAYAGAFTGTNTDAASKEFLDSYLSAGAALLPSDPQTTMELLEAFVLDKAVYELGYEQAHRPDWVEIPLAAVRLLSRR